MSDIADQSQWLEETDRAAGVSRAVAALRGAGSDICEDCGDGISPARRRAMPAAALCIDCQQKAERQQRVTGAPHGGIEIFRGPL